MRSILIRDRVEMLHRMYSSAAVDCEDIDDARYTLQKKISEVSKHRAHAVTAY